MRQYLQLIQFLNLLFLVLLGAFFAHLYLPLVWVAGVLICSIIIEHLFIYIKNRILTYFSFSSLSTAIGVILMTVTTHWWMIICMITLGLLQKHFLQISGKHLFNPSNFALISGMVLCYHDTHIVTGQLGDAVWFAVVVVLLSIWILYWAKRWIIPTIFILSYIGWQYLLIVQHDPVVYTEMVFYRFYAVSFLIFVLFMLTDPLTTPERPWVQILFASLIALGATLLDYGYGFRVQHLFMVLFVLTPLFGMSALWHNVSAKQKGLLVSVLFLALGAIIYIEIQPPYHFAMERAL